jgi:hypothetical protein
MVGQFARHGTMMAIALALLAIAMSWSRFVGRVGSEVKVYPGC